MRLTRQSIINQLCHELLAWKALNLRPAAILGTRNPVAAFELYSQLLKNAPLINTAAALEQLGLYSVNIHNLGSELIQYFRVDNARLPENPYFCATSLFREAITKNTIPLEYDDAAQTVLIASNLDFAYHSAAENHNGVTIAAETGNEEMVSFLLDKSLLMFDLAKEYPGLLDNPLVTLPPVREAIFRACGLRFVPGMMDKLIQRMKTVDEWIALYQALKDEQRQQLLNGSTAAIWTTLNPNDAQIQTIIRLIPQEASVPFLTSLVSIIQCITDGPLVIHLMDRMTQADRQIFVLNIGDRVNTLFSVPANLEACLTLLGYSFDAANHRFTLNHIHLAEQPLLDVVHRLNQEIWESTLDIHMKLRYFHLTQQLLLANPGARSACTSEYEDCIKQCESMLRDQADAGLNWFWQVLNVLGRFFGFISDFPVTLQARNLLSMVNNAVAGNTQFHAVILDLSHVILPLDAPESQRRKDAIGALTPSPSQRDYALFWKKCGSEERASLLIDQPRFQQLLQMFSNDDNIDESIQNLMRGLTVDMYEKLLDVGHPAALLSLLQMPRLPLPMLLGCLRDFQKNPLLSNPVWFGEIMSKLPAPVIQEFLRLIDQTILTGTRNSLPHIQSALVKADQNRFSFLGQYFGSSISLNKTPQEIGGLIEAIPIEKLLPFWTTFLPDRAFTVAEMAQLLPVVRNADKRGALISYWFGLLPLPVTPITAWTDDLFILLPDMTPAQQAHTISVMSADDLRRLNDEGKIEFMISILTSGNDLAILDRYRPVFSEPDELNRFLNQLQPPLLELLLSKPPFDFLRLLDGHTLQGLIRSLKLRTDAQWDVFVPKLLGMAVSINGSEDTLVALLQQHVPPRSHEHLLNLLHTGSDEEISCLFDQYLNTKIVQALMLHKKLDFMAITLDGIRGIMRSVPNAPIKPQLIDVSDKLFHELIQSHLVKLNQQLKGLEASIVTAQTGLLALMVPYSGLFSYSFSKEVTVTITQKWAAIVVEIQQLRKHHAELVKFCSIRHYDEAMVALKPIHERISQLVTHRMDTFIHQNEEAITKAGLKVTYSSQNTNAVEALRQVEVSLQKMNRDEEAQLLDAIPDADIINKMKTGDEIKNFFALIVTPENEAHFLEHCRRLLVTKNLWQDLSPSSLTLLSKDATKALFKPVSPGDFMSLVSAFRYLAADRWNALAPNLLAVRTQHFNQSDRLVSLLQKDVPASAHLHVLNLIRTTPDEAELNRLLDYFTSDVVREYKKHNQIDDTTITIAALPELKQAAGDWFDAKVKTKEHQLRGEIDHLKNQLSGLIEQFNAPKKTSWTFFSSYLFKPDDIKLSLDAVPQTLDAITADIKVLNDLHAIKLDKSSSDFMIALKRDLNTNAGALKTFMISEDGEAKLPQAPWCHYRDNKKDKYAKNCLTEICSELTILAGGEDELAMEATLSRSAAAQSGAF